MPVLDISGVDTRYSTSASSVREFTYAAPSEPPTKRRPVTQDIATWMRKTQPPGAVWLAGYARSGAALIRSILAHNFGQQTASVYPEAKIGDAYTAALKCLHWPISTDAMHALLARQKTIAIKTHEYPTRPAEPVRSIIIVRDARRVFASPKAFYAARNDTDVSMTDIIRGDHLWRDWSGWIRAWAYASRPDTLWLRYEDVMAQPWKWMNRLARWLDCPRRGGDFPAFDDLHKANPGIFRCAATTGNGGMTDDEEKLFWQLHGGTMRMLGYHE